MFTGLIEGTGKVSGFEGNSSEGGLLRVENVPWQGPLGGGESIAVNGACLTVVNASESSFDAELSPETLQRTNLGQVTSGELVNLERPLRLGDRLGGHIVLGHVDGVGSITGIEEAGDFWNIEVEKPEYLSKYAVEKGSIALDGISLTIASLLDANRISVAVIPKTMELTNLSTRKIGDAVNIEVDIVAKHIERLVEAGMSTSEVTTEILNEQGFG